MIEAGSALGLADLGRVPVGFCMRAPNAFGASPASNENVLLVP